MKTVLVVSTPFLEELRESAAIAAQNDEAQIEAAYLQKAADEIERQQALIAKLLKTTIVGRRLFTPPAAKANSVKLFSSQIEVSHGDHEYLVETYFAAKNQREALIYANRHANKLFADARREDGYWSANNGALAWKLIRAIEVPALHVSGADGKARVFDVVCQPSETEARYDS